MKIPAMDKTGSLPRLQFFDEIVAACEATRQDRITRNENLRRYYLFGGQSQGDVKFNKIYPSIQLLSSFLYAQETTRFGISFGPEVPEEQRSYADVMRKRISDVWHDSNTDITFGEASTWASVYGSMFVKLIRDKYVKTFLCEPHMMGVLREDVSEIDRQEAISQVYYITKSQLTNQLASHPQGKEILELVDVSKHQEQSTVPQVISRVIITSTSPNLQGAASLLPLTYEYVPDVYEPLIEMRELWIYDDDIRDYRVITRAEPRIIIYDRKGEGLFMKGEHPFVKVCPSPINNYFWGESLVQSLIPLQDWRDEILKKIDNIIRRQLRPSRIGIGMSGLTDEKMLALDKEGGFYNAPQPNSKFETYKPDLDEHPFKLVQMMDEMIDETLGFTPSLRAMGEQGVRAGSDRETLIRVGGSRIKRRALITEDSIEKLATMMLKFDAQESKVIYLDDKKKKFMLSQVDPNFVVKVSAHSSTPIFSEETKQIAWMLKKDGAIGNDTLIEMLEPPMMETMLSRLKGLEEGQGKLVEIKVAEELSKVQKNLAQAQMYAKKVG